jgi:small subunit ribosomal protein S4
MAQYHGPVCRFCRRENQKLFLKGERCLTDKCSFERRAYPPGQHGQKRGKLSEFGQQLREKQKVRRVYGLTEKSMRIQFRKASAQRGVASDIFFRNLEQRLDNVVYRMGFARSRTEARQIVRHNHILVNGSRVNMPGANVAIGDVVLVSEKSRSMGVFPLAAELFAKRAASPWVEVDHKAFSGKVIAAPTREDIHLNVKERMIVELYNK